MALMLNRGAVSLLNVFRTVKVTLPYDNARRLFVNAPNVAPGEAIPTGMVDDSYKPTPSRGGQLTSRKFLS